jgi:hypothetical protein
VSRRPWPPGVVTGPAGPSFNTSTCCQAPIAAFHPSRTAASESSEGLPAWASVRLASAALAAAASAYIVEAHTPTLSSTIRRVTEPSPPPPPGPDVGAPSSGSGPPVIE